MFKPWTHRTVRLPDIPRRFRNIEVVTVVSCVVVRGVRKLFGFPWDDSSEVGVNLSSLYKVFAYKTIERLDESLAEEVTVACNCLGLDDVWGRAKFRSFAKHSF